MFSIDPNELQRLWQQVEHSLDWLGPILALDAGIVVAAVMARGIINIIISHLDDLWDGKE